MPTLKNDQIPNLKLATLNIWFITILNKIIRILN